MQLRLESRDEADQLAPASGKRKQAWRCWRQRAPPSPERRVEAWGEQSVASVWGPRRDAEEQFEKEERGFWVKWAPSRGDGTCSTGGLAPERRGQKNRGSLSTGMPWTGGSCEWNTPCLQGRRERWCPQGAASHRTCLPLHSGSQRHPERLLRMSPPAQWTGLSVSPMVMVCPTPWCTGVCSLPVNFRLGGWTQPSVVSHCCRNPRSLHSCGCV